MASIQQAFAAYIIAKQDSKAAPGNHPSHFSTLPMTLATGFLLSSSLLLQVLCFLFL